MTADTLNGAGVLAVNDASYEDTRGDTRGPMPRPSCLEGPILSPRRRRDLSWGDG
jgi:hypothetical protein